MEHDSVIGEKMFLSARETRTEITRILKCKSLSLRERGVLVISGRSSYQRACYTVPSQAAARSEADQPCGFTFRLK